MLKVLSECHLAKMKRPTTLKNNPNANEISLNYHNYPFCVPVDFGSHSFEKFYLCVTTANFPIQFIQKSQFKKLFYILLIR